MSGLQKLAAEIAGHDEIKGRIGLNPIVVAMLIEMLPVILNELFRRCQEPDTPAELRGKIVSSGAWRRWQQKRVNVAVCDYDEEIYDDLGKGFGEVVLATLEDASDEDLEDLMKEARKRRRRRFF